MSTEQDPLDDPGYQEFLSDMAKKCRSEVQRPCPGCCAGGMCDSFFEGAGRVEERDELDEFADEDW